MKKTAILLEYTFSRILRDILLARLTLVNSLLAVRISSNLLFQIFGDLQTAVVVLTGGGGEIRTLGERKPTTVFKTVTLNHSVTLPQNMMSQLGGGGEIRTPAAGLPTLTIQQTVPFSHLGNPPYFRVTLSTQLLCARKSSGTASVQQFAFHAAATWVLLRELQGRISINTVLQQHNLPYKSRLLSHNLL